MGKSAASIARINGSCTKKKKKGQPLSGMIQNLQPGPMVLNNTFDYHQPQAESTGCVCLERFEDSTDFIFPDPAAGIGQ
jgi:hypothetical protein